MTTRERQERDDLQKVLGAIEQLSNQTQLSPFEAAQLSLLLMIARSLGEQNIQNRSLYPEPTTYAFFANDGTYQPIAAGNTTIDLRRGQVVAPNGTFPISQDVQFMDQIQSAFFIADSACTISVYPGVGAAKIYISSPFYATGRDIERFTISALVPYNLFFILGNGPTPPKVEATAWFMERSSSMTLSKGSAANVADSWAQIIWVPQSGAKVLSQAQFGSAILLPIGVGQKEFLIRNLSTSGMEFRLRGAVDLANQITLNSSTTSMDYVLDADIHVAGTPTASFVSIPAGTPGVLESSIYYGAMVLEARLTAAVAQGTTGTCYIEYSGQSYNIR